MKLKAIFGISFLISAQVYFSDTRAVTSVSLLWDRSPDNVAGYAIWYGLSGGSQTNSIDVGNTLSATVQNLTPGQTYFFYATAYDSNHVQSDPSNRLTKTIPSDNTAPTLDSIADRYADEGKVLQLVASASDSDSPAQTLTFSLGVGTPAGAAINMSSGLFSWQPASTQAPSTNRVTIIVSDNGIPSMSATQSFTVIVREGYYLTLGSYSHGSVQINPTGTLNPAGTKYITGTTVSASAQPDVAAAFDHWSLNGVNFTQNPLTFLMDGNKSLTPYFRFPVLLSGLTATSPSSTSGGGGGGQQTTLASATPTQTTSTSLTPITTAVASPTTTITAPATNQWVLEASTNSMDWNIVTNGVTTSDVQTNLVYRVRLANAPQ